MFSRVSHRDPFWGRWNLVYDGLLKKFQDIPRMSAVAFADDWAFVRDVASQEEIGDRLGKAMSMVKR